MAYKLTTQNCIIAREDRLCYSSPAHIPLIELCNIFGSSKIRIRLMSTSQTLNKSTMPFSFNVVTDRTRLRSVSRIDINNPNSFFQSLVFNKLLQLIETPFVNPFIVFGTLPNSFQIFHDDYIAIIQTSNNRFANVVITPSHKPFPTSTHSLEFSSGSLRAFRLKNRNKSIMLDSQLLNVFTIKFSIRSNSDFIDAEVNAQNSVTMLRKLDIFPSECKSEIIFISVFSQKTLPNLPIIKILQRIIRNLDRNFNSALNGRDTQNIIFEGKGTRSIVSDRNLKYVRIRFCFLNNSTSLFNTGDGKLRRQSHLSQIRINKRMQLNIISNLHSPSNINTMLESFFIEFDSFDNQIINFNLNWDTSQHCKNIKESPYLNISEGSIPPTSEEVGILEQII